MLPRAEIKGKNQVERWVIRIMKATIVGVLGYLTLALFAVIQSGCQKKDKWPEGFTMNQAIVESARILQTPVGQCWGGDGSWQCLSRSGLWTVCQPGGCELILYVNGKDREYFQK